MFDLGLEAIARFHLLYLLFSSCMGYTWLPCDRHAEIQEEYYSHQFERFTILS
ncbi:hypothetical protein VB735_19765 [Halotia wernerae UHCC 0503]|nr:hypothetical protein [Halotia wernerae UHCC 0503]